MRNREVRGASRHAHTSRMCKLCSAIVTLSIPEQVVIEMVETMLFHPPFPGIAVVHSLMTGRFRLAELLVAKGADLSCYEKKAVFTVGKAIQIGAPFSLVKMLVDKSALSFAWDRLGPANGEPLFLYGGFSPMYSLREVFDIVCLIMKECRGRMGSCHLRCFVRNHRDAWLADPHLLFELFTQVTRFFPQFHCDHIIQAFDNCTGSELAISIGASAISFARLERQYMPLLVGVRAQRLSVLSRFVRHPLYTRDVLRAILHLLK